MKDIYLAINLQCPDVRVLADRALRDERGVAQGYPEAIIRRLKMQRKLVL